MLFRRNGIRHASHVLIVRSHSGTVHSIWSKVYPIVSRIGMLFSLRSVLAVDIRLRLVIGGWRRWETLSIPIASLVRAATTTSKARASSPKMVNHSADFTLRDILTFHIFKFFFQNILTLQNNPVPPHCNNFYYFVYRHKNFFF